MVQEMMLDKVVEDSARKSLQRNLAQTKPIEAIILLSVVLGLL